MPTAARLIPQDALRDLVAAIGGAAQERELRRMRRMAVLMLTLSRWYRNQPWFRR
jgi:hypothetical protein